MSQIDTHCNMNPICTKKFHRLQCLIDSCKSGDDKKLKYILETEDCNGFLDSSDQNGRTLLHYCAEHENTECASLLLQKRPQLLNLQDDEGCTPLHLATISGNIPFLEFLIKESRKLLQEKQFNAFIDCYDNENHTAYHWATVCGEVECIKILQVAGADPSLPDIHGARPIHYASQLDTGNRVSSRRSEVIEAILSYAPTENDARDKDGRTPLLWAASSGNVEAIELLTRMKADVTLQDHDGLTSLHCAASRGYLECLECLLELCGSPVDQIDSSGASALFYAVTLGHADCTQFLLHEAAAPNRQDRKGRTPAHCGAAKGQLETLKILSQNGGNLWLKNSRGDLPIHDAVKSGRKELVRWLLEQLPSGAEFPNASGKTPLHVACFNGNIEMCQLLIESGMDVNVLMKSKNGWMTPLDVCLVKGHRSCAKFILLHGALPASKLPDGYGGHSSNDAILETESHSSSQSFIKEVRVPSKTHLKNLTKTVTSQKVQVFSDDMATPNSCVETTLSTDSRPETIITNVYVNTCSDSRKKSTLSKLIRRRSKKRSRSDNSSGRNSEVREDRVVVNVMINGEKSQQHRSKFESNELNDEQVYDRELSVNREQTDDTFLKEVIGIQGTENTVLNRTINQVSGGVQNSESQSNSGKMTNGSDRSNEVVTEPRVNEIPEKQDEPKDGETYQESSNTDQLETSEKVPEETFKVRSKRHIIDANEELKKDLDDNFNEELKKDLNDISDEELKKDVEDDLNEESKKDLDDQLKDELEEIEENDMKHDEKDEELMETKRPEFELDENENRAVEVVEYAQLLTDKLMGSGELIDKLLSEAVKDQSEYHFEENQNGDGNRNDFLLEGEEDAEKKDETISENGLESEEEIATPKSSERSLIENNKLTPNDSDSNSLHESVSADETVVASIDDPATVNQKVHCQSTTFEIRDHKDDVGDDRMRASFRRKKSSTRNKRRNHSHCTHKYHFKQSFTTIQPLDLQHVRPKVDTGRSSSCTKSCSRSSDHKAEFEAFVQNGDVRSDQSLRKYYTERKLFEELRELKRCQIKSDRAHEKILVRRLIDNFEREINYPGIVKYDGSYDYKSYERYLYDQLRHLSQSNQSKMKKYSSEESILPIPRMFQKEEKQQRSCSAEYLSQERHQADRFISLEDHHPIERSQRSPAKWEKTTYHKVNSDVVRTAESLDYAIITRDGSSNIFRKETAIKFEPHTSLPPLSATSTSRLRAVTSEPRPLETTKKSRTYISKKIETRTEKVGNSTSTTVDRSTVERDTSKDTYHRLFYSSGSTLRNKPQTNRPSELKRKKSEIPPATKLVIGEEDISRRWHAIKEQEKLRRASDSEKAKTSSSPNLRDCTLIYEINCSKSAPGQRKRIRRTISEPRVTEKSK